MRDSSIRLKVGLLGSPWKDFTFLTSILIVFYCSCRFASSVLALRVLIAPGQLLCRQTVEIEAQFLRKAQLPKVSGVRGQWLVICLPEQVHEHIAYILLWPSMRQTRCCVSSFWCQPMCCSAWLVPFAAMLLLLLHGRRKGCSAYPGV